MLIWLRLSIYIQWKSTWADGVHFVIRCRRARCARLDKHFSRAGRGWGMRRSTKESRRLVEARYIPHRGHHQALFGQSEGEDCVSQETCAIDQVLELAPSLPAPAPLTEQGLPPHSPQVIPQT
ncbi:hypothetical protein F751_4429 [Auxenochlorella protothecoides]|uniref:Uncharacterized protein n=1 Tax=Auxenochlorella protothecoides TaxID=3075 RepID=A0A087SN55_AUXPR|nr:hypothetical protein F751_4429 [Auxenochlorella protothecoides]KFM27159.1 hypothetical protein F751_4429 [Auxenochlorella protothecoides]